MSVASRNPFMALAEDGDDFQAAPAAAKAPAAKAPAAQAPRNIPGAGQKTATRNPNPRGTNAAKNNRTGIPAEAGAEGEAQQRDVRGGRGGRSSEGRGRGARGARGGRGRQFDRHSQTDRVDTQKNLHQGWGGDEPKRELDVEKKAEADAKAENIEANGAPAAEGEAKPEEEKPVEEEEDKTMTLDEYLAAQAEKRAALAAPKGREASKDDSAWSNFGVQVKKSEGDDYFAAKKDQKAKAKAQKEGKQFLEIEQRFDQPAASSRARCGRVSA
ncbi:uncharacterized protein PFL1_05066 [Pseudozyma flocculosa PF-1]|uniref:Hyaluronan/mRNA-binding protein domain-containing protein n=1 Tax=Pseudozyma flocculosa PF-1 TaxID=1277687 RepID=A0A061H4M2_9BASI|nr:uncharacterized protein PFL1_05066 [Pseudozyma flocculosa PF-1]EPQ27528.1 hypothetical protein PFL1_05066 [Pseudozyma flocculosa PF-1]